jgi:hypothetical protein
MTTATPESHPAQDGSPNEERSDPPPKLDDLLHEARRIEREIAELADSALSGHEECELRVKQLDQAIESGLCKPLDAKIVTELREVATRGRIKYTALARLLEKAHKAADRGEETWALHDAAVQLGEHELQKDYAEMLSDFLAHLRVTRRWSQVFSNQLYQDTVDHRSLFEQLQR